MAGGQYFVVLHKGQWKISHNGYFYGPYNFKPEAISVAVEIARKMGKQGYDAQVLVQGIDRKVHPEWTYGYDPYPPRPTPRPTPLSEVRVSTVRSHG